MFERLRFQQPTEKSIVLQTRQGRNIKNIIDIEPEPHHIQKYQRLLRKHHWEERKPPSGGYNCVGHVWASRRTGVFDDVEDQIRMIFDDDGYRKVDPTTEPLRKGDLVTYWLAARPNPQFLHVGMIFEIREGVTSQSPGIPWVLSKMDSTSGEVLHHYANVAFIEGVEHTVAIWTDRPIQTQGEQE